MKLVAPTTLERVLLSTSLKQIVAPSALHGTRRVTLLAPPDNVYVGIDEDIKELNSDRFPFTLSQLPANRDIAFHLQPHQTLVAAVRTGVGAVGVLVEHFAPEGA